MKKAKEIEEEKLPPHAAASELGVLGSIMHEPARIREARERVPSPEAFYVLKNREIWEAMVSLDDKGRTIDTLTLSQELKDKQKLDGVGGYIYLSKLQDYTPYGAAIDGYIESVREKYLARLKIKQSLAVVNGIMSVGGLNEQLIARAQELEKQFTDEVQRGSLTPKFLQPASFFGDQVWDAFFGANAGTIPGMELPIDFKLKIRRGEMTLVTGDDGSGKSTWLLYALLHLANQGAKSCIASFEVPPRTTLWMLICQALGTRDIPDCEAGHALFKSALEWVSPRFVLYDFLGISDWRDVINSFRYAADKHGCNVFVIDSAMRIGIPDDDYATQGVAGAQFAQFAKDTNSHLFLVIHENKGAEKGKARVRGSKLWTANVDNIVKIARNVEKSEKLDELWAMIDAERKRAKPDTGKLDDLGKRWDEWKEKWDSQMVLLKQRFPGSQQNASKYVYFSGKTFQFREHRNDPPVNWIERWNRSRVKQPQP